MSGEQIVVDARQDQAGHSTLVYAELQMMALYELTS